MKTKTTKLRNKRSTQLLRECWSFLTKLMTCQNLQNKLLNITVLLIWYLLASLKKMSLAKHGELYFILVSTCFSPLAILMSVWNKWFPTLTLLSFYTCFDWFKKLRLFVNVRNRKIDVVVKASHAVVIRWFSLNEAPLRLFKFISDYLPYFEKINIFFNIITKKVWINL
jgi:hypothetical protein